MNGDDEIRKSEERKRIEEERIEREYRKIVKEYEEKRRKEIPLRVRISERVRGGQERFVAGARKAGGAAREGVRRAAAYEPSEGTKKAVKEVGQTFRSEFQEASNYYTGGGSRKGRKGRRGSSDVFDVNSLGTLGIFEPEPTGREVHDPLETASFASYLDNFDPFKQAAKQKDDQYAQYVANFDVLNQSTTPSTQKGKRQRSNDIISRWFE